MHTLLSSSRLLAVVLMTQAHAVLDAPKQHGITTVGDDVIHLGRSHHYACTLAHMTQGIAA